MKESTLLIAAATVTSLAGASLIRELVDPFIVHADPVNIMGQCDQDAETYGWQPCDEDYNECIRTGCAAWATDPITNMMSAGFYQSCTDIATNEYSCDPPITSE